MLGIKGIGSYIPENFIEATSLIEKFDVTEEFIREKTGFHRLARKDIHETVVDMCAKALENYCAKDTTFSIDQVDFICVCTQNPTQKIPQQAALLQARLGVPQHSAGFDISLGCSGYPYGLCIALSFMEKAGLKKGLVFTCDPYSGYMDQNDKNMQLLFGDAATVTYIAENPVLCAHDFSFETFGEHSQALKSSDDGHIHMDGRAIFNFALRNVTMHVKKMQEKHGEQDIYLLHQGSRFMLDMACKSIKLSTSKVPFLATNYGNTVSSSIPLLLEQYVHDQRIASFAICGFGVGLSIASAILRRV